MIELTNISKSYEMGEETVHALQDVNLKIEDGEYVAIIGPSGSGKSTLMYVLGCLDIPTSGDYRLNGQLVSNMRESQLATVRNKNVGLVFQQFNLLGRASAIRNVELPARYGGVKAAERHNRAVEAMNSVGLGNRLHHKPTELSGGQQQRVAIARALINRPTILLADEPTGALDSKTGREILDLFEQLQRERHITVIVVTHDPNVAKRAHRVITIRDGRIESDITRPPSAAREGAESAHDIYERLASDGPPATAAAVPVYQETLAPAAAATEQAAAGTAGNGFARMPLKRIALMGLLAAVIAIVVNILIGQLAGALFSIRAAMFQPVLVALFTAAGVLGATVVYALINRFAKAPPARLFRIVALVVLLITLLPDVGFAAGLVNPYSIVGGFQRGTGTATQGTGGNAGAGFAFRGAGGGAGLGAGGRALAGGTGSAGVASQATWPVAVSMGLMNVAAYGVSVGLLTRRPAKKRAKARR
jgi:putative ABC transport system ATP-binding protein